MIEAIAKTLVLNGRRGVPPRSDEAGRLVYYPTLIIALLLTVAQFAFADEPPAAAPPEPRLSGVRELSADELAAFHERMFVLTPERVTQTPLPRSVYNITHLPVVGSQGSLGACAAFSAAYYYKTYQEARERGWERPDPKVHPERVASPMWAFNVTRQGLSDAGVTAISTYGALELFVKHGCATWEDMPYAATNNTSYIPDDPAVWRRAMTWRARDMGRIPGINTPSGLSLLKRHLAGGDLAVVAIGRDGGLHYTFQWYPESTGSNGIHNAVYFRDHGLLKTVDSHSLVLVGYDDDRAYIDDRTGEERRGAFLLVNSWGPTWGVGAPEAGSAGFIWIAYDYVLDGGLSQDALIMRDRNAYEPTHVAVVGIDAPDADSVNWNPYTIETVRGRQSVFPWINADGPVERSFAVDISDLFFPPVSRIAFSAYHVTADPATITNFWLETFGGEWIWTSDETPATPPVLQPLPMLLEWLALQPETVGLEDLRMRAGTSAFADANGNGYPDLVVTGERFTPQVTGGEPSTTLWINQGDGTFAEQATTLPGTVRGAVVWSDVNNNGIPDLWMGGESDTRLYWNDGAGGFTDSGIRLPAAGAGGIAAADYNRDGRPDLALAATNGIFVFRQDPDGGFTPLRLDERGIPFNGLMAARPGMLAWGDATGNGLPDLLATGVGHNRPLSESAWDMATVLYRNDGNDEFTIIPVDIPHLGLAAIAWTDFDNDGIDDVAISGSADPEGGGSAQKGVTRLFRGLGNGVMEAVEPAVPLTGLYAGNMQWADFDHNGRRDLVMTGRKFYYGAIGSVDTELDFIHYPNRTVVWRNLRDDYFEEADCRLPGVSGVHAMPPLAVADVTGDGSPDFFAAGTRARSTENKGHRIESFLIRNRSAEFLTHGGPNQPPTAPVNFDAVPAGDGALTLNWSGATDDVTPEAGLRYIVRLGTSPGAGDIASGAVHPSDWGGLVRSGVSYRDLPAGTLYWSVRTVDSGLALSPWSAEQAVVVPDYTPRVWIRIAADPDYGGATDPATNVWLDRGATLTLTAAPASGFRFSHWGGNASDGINANPLVWSVDHGVRLVAHFEPLPNPALPAWVAVDEPEMTGFSGGIGAGLIGFNQRLYLMGWRRGSFSTRNNLILFSEAGNGYELGQRWDWDMTHTYADWSARSHHGVHLFNGRMWVIGGHTTDWTAVNDVWSSADGLTWTQHTASAPWEERMSPATAVFDNHLWVIGGRDDSFNALLDVWKSSDGDAWTLVTDTSTAPWQSPAGGYNRSVAVPFGQQLILLVGGTHSGHEVWSTTDGLNWTLLTDDVPWRNEFEAAAMNGRLIVAVGSDSQSGYPGQAVWESTDGIHWLRTAPRNGVPHWEARSEPAMTVAQGRAWLVSGRRNSSHQGFEDVWFHAPTDLPAGDGELRLTVTPLAGGTVSPAADVYRDVQGTVFALQAVPAPGYIFDGWDGPVNDPDESATTVTLARMTEVNARFVLEDHSVTLLSLASPTSGGTVQPSGFIHGLPAGQPQTVNARPAWGYRFSHWSGPVADPLSPTTTVTPLNDVQIVAHFLPQSLAAGSGHSVTVKGDRTLWVWGEGYAGQSGRAEGMTSSGLPPLAEWADVAAPAAGDQFSVAAAGPWGVNAGQWGYPSAWIWGAIWTASRPAENEWELDPVNLTIEGRIAGLAAGARVVLLVGADGRLWSAGHNGYGQLGSAVAHATAPLLVRGPGGVGSMGNIVAAAVGGRHALALDRNGRVWGWGGNAVGEVDPALNGFLETPAPVSGLPTVRAIAAGGDALGGGRGYAIDWDGVVWQWGAGLNLPEPVSGMPPVIAITAGARHALALGSDGLVYAWGENRDGQLGDGSFTARMTPVQVSGLTSIVEVAAGSYHSLARDAEGRIFAWGDDLLGAVSGTPDGPITTPLEIEAMHLDAPSIPFRIVADPPDAGNVFPRREIYHARFDSVVPLRAVPDERYLFMLWEGPVDSIYSPETTQTIFAPVELSARFELRPDVDARLTMHLSPTNAGFTTPPAGDHDFARNTIVPVRADHFHRWRFDGWDGPVLDSAARETTVSMEFDREISARFVPLTFQAVPQIAAAKSFRKMHVNMLSADAAVYTAGPDGMLSEHYTVTLVQRAAGQGPLTNIIQVTCSGHNLALDVDGYVFAWGGNRQGQCGLGYDSWSLIEQPRPVLGMDGDAYLRDIQQVATVGDVSLALTSEGSVLQWGLISGYQHAATNRPVPLPVTDGEPFTDVIAVAAGPAAAALIRHGGSVWTWTPDSLPVRVDNLTGVTAVSIGGSGAGQGHFLALLANGTVRAWGANDHGQLGNGTTVASATPVTVQGLSGVIAVSAGYDHSLALTASGKVYSWGGNQNGQLGDGTQTDRSLPAMIDALNDIRQISAGYYAGHALDAQGRLIYWGFVLHPNPALSLLTPVQDPQVQAGSMDGQIVRLTLAVDPDESAGTIFPGEGVFAYNPGDIVELRATPAEDYRLLSWSDGQTSLWRTVTMDTDRDLTAEFILIEPIIRLEHVSTTPDQPVRMRVVMEEGKLPYAGFNAALLLPPGIHLADAMAGIDVPEDFSFDAVSRPAPGGGVLVSLVAFAPEHAIEWRDGELAVLTLRADASAAGGTLPVTWVAGRAWTRCPHAVLADAADLMTVRPTLEPGSVTVAIGNRVHAALRVAEAPALTGRLSDQEFGAYPNRLHYRQDEPYVAEVWLRNTGTNVAGIISARVNLEVTALDEQSEPVVFGALQHGLIYSHNPSGAVDGQRIRNFGATVSGSTGEGGGGWVRLGWVPVTAPRAETVISWDLAFGDGAPLLTDATSLDSRFVAGGPLTVRTLAELPRAALGTPHWWLDTYGLVELGVIDYNAAETNDYRGDGLIARQAYIAGIDPTDVNSRFIVAEIMRGATHDEIVWPGVAGRIYRVYRATTLGSGAIWTLVHGPVDCATNQVLTFTPDHDGQPRRFYRIDVKLKP